MSSACANVLSLLAALQTVENPVLFGSDAGSSISVETISELNCAHDRAKIRYAVRSSGGDRIISASINKRSVRQSDIEMINSGIGSKHIAKIRWEICPASKRDETPIRFYIEYEPTHETIDKKIMTALLLRRDGTFARQ